MNLSILDMFPNLSQANATNIVVSRFKFFSQFSRIPSFFSKASYFKNLFFGKSCAWMIGSAMGFMSSFGHFISVIVSDGSKKQMLGIATRWIVARVANAKTFLDGTMSFYPSYSVRSVFDSVRSTSAITFGIYIFKPRPAGIVSATFINIKPKVFRSIDRVVSLRRSTAAKSCIMHPAVRGIFSFFRTIYNGAYSHMTRIAHVSNEVNHNYGGLIW